MDIVFMCDPVTLNYQAVPSACNVGTDVETLSKKGWLMCPQLPLTADEPLSFRRLDFGKNTRDIEFVVGFYNKNESVAKDVSINFFECKSLQQEVLQPEMYFNITQISAVDDIAPKESKLFFLRIKYLGGLTTSECVCEIVACSKHNCTAENAYESSRIYIGISD
ncbi:MAG: hypothetical protein ABIF10_08310 [Candidatus Woesearchaeota archaeon]